MNATDRPRSGTRRAGKQAKRKGPKLLHVSFRHRGFSDHYYHFLFGVVLPLCRYLDDKGGAGRPIVLASCGPLDAILNSLRLPRMIVTDRTAHRRLGKRMAPRFGAAVVLDGFDISRRNPTYDAAAIRAGAAWLMRRLQGPIARRRSMLEAGWTERPRVLVIDRGPADPHYAATDRGDGTAGAGRRRVANHAEMAAALAARFPGCRDLCLEGRSLPGQIALFQLADAVVAQHGAALGNMVWMADGARIVEFAGGMGDFDEFGDLAAALGFAHVRIPQAGSFAAVEVASVADAVAAMFEKPAG